MARSVVIEHTMKRNNGLNLFLTAVLVAGLVLIAGPLAMAVATTWYVDDDTCPATGSGTAADPYCKIQDAINAASAGDIINVAAGTYNEKVFVDESVTLNGAQAGVDARGRTGLPKSIIGPKEAYVVVVQADNVTIDGFEITSSVDWNCDNAGIYVSDNIGQPGEGDTELNNIVVKNCRIHDLTDGNRDGGQGIHGIVVGPKTDGVELAYNEIYSLHLIDDSWGYTPVGIMIWGNAGEEAKNTNVHHNLIHTIANDDSTVEPRGIQPSMKNHNTTVADNEIYGVKRGMRLHSDSTGTLSVTGNNVHDCTVVGMRVERAGTVTGNTLTNNGVQIRDINEDLDIATVLANNTFDRAVTVDHPGASLLHTIWSKIQDGIDAAVAGDTINVAAGTYTEATTIPAGADLVLQGGSRDVTTWIAPADDASRMHCIKSSLSGHTGATTLDISGFTFSVEDNAISTSTSSR